MSTAISRVDARRLISTLFNAPIAPGRYSHFINVGTDHIIDSLDQNYFRRDLADGIGCFKYLEGDYGSGKTQFINSLAQRASEQEIVTALVTVGAECPFNSPAAIFRAIMESFQPPAHDSETGEATGIEILIDDWITRRIRHLGAEPGEDVPELVQRQIESQLGGLWKGAPDSQMAAGLTMLSRRLLKTNCGATEAVADSELISWVRGDQIRSATLRGNGLFEPVRDETAFRRLKTVISFLRTRMAYRGFLIAFDEGTRTSSFRRGTIKQKQAIENLLTMINQNAEGEFGGVMFLYAATPDFRSEVISTYRALQDRIGSVAFSPGSPLVPLINIEDTNSEQTLGALGEKLRDVFSKAYEMEWDDELQTRNMKALVEAQKRRLFETPPPRLFVYHYCRFLSGQQDSQSAISDVQADTFVSENEPPLEADTE